MRKNIGNEPPIKFEINDTSHPYDNYYCKYVNSETDEKIKRPIYEDFFDKLGWKILSLQKSTPYLWQIEITYPE